MTKKKKRSKPIPWFWFGPNESHMLKPNRPKRKRERSGD